MCATVILDNDPMPQPRPISPPTGKLGVLLPGLGAVSSTLIAGVETARQTGAVPPQQIEALLALP